MSVVHGVAVVGEGDRTCFGELDEIGELLAFATPRDRGDRPNTCALGPAWRARVDLFHERGRVDRRIRVRHRTDRRESAMQRGVRAGRKGFRFLKARLTEVRMEVHEPRHLDVSTFQLHARSSTGVAVPAPASRYNKAIRTATPFVTCASMSERVPCATAGSISIPSFIGPGCITGAPERIRATRSAVRPQTREYSRRDGRSPDAWRSRWIRSAITAASVRSATKYGAPDDACRITTTSPPSACSVRTVS